jgi:hypothetical protein
VAEACVCVYCIQVDGWVTDTHFWPRMRYSTSSFQSVTGTYIITSLMLVPYIKRDITRVGATSFGKGACGLW